MRGLRQPRRARAISDASTRNSRIWPRISFHSIQARLAAARRRQSHERQAAGRCPDGGRPSSATAAFSAPARRRAGHPLRYLVTLFAVGKHKLDVTADTSPAIKCTVTVILAASEGVIRRPETKRRMTLIRPAGSDWLLSRRRAPHQVARIERSEMRDCTGQPGPGFRCAQSGLRLLRLSALRAMLRAHAQERRPAMAFSLTSDSYGRRPTSCRRISASAAPAATSRRTCDGRARRPAPGASRSPASTPTRRPGRASGTGWWSTSRPA